MSISKQTRSLLVILSIFSFIIITTVIISFIAHGYQFDFKGAKTTIKATGILSATSKPKSASVFINDRLVTATDDTLNLSPNKYSIKIVKDGYLPWQKNITIKEEVVFQTDAQLFRSSPDLKSVTQTGVINPAISPDNTKIIYAVSSASAQADNGLYIIELTDSPILINRNSPRQLAPDFSNVVWSKAKFEFSPNSRQVIATFSQENVSYLIDLSTSISNNQLYDITPRLPVIKEEWNKLNNQIIQSKLEKIPDTLKSLISTDSAKNILLTPLEDKILYLASSSGQIPENIITPPPAQSNQTQSRQLEANNYYVYDIKDDTNFLIGKKDDITNPVWLPNSNNLVFVHDNNIKTIEYDATNIQTLFSGEFDKTISLPWSDGSRIITLTSTYSGSPTNLYAIIIK